MTPKYEVRESHDQPCDTGCREEILNKVSECVTMGGILKVWGTFSAVFLFVVAISIGAYQSSQAAQNDEIRLMKQQVQTNTIIITEMRKDLQYLKEGQAAIHSAQKENSDAIINELKKLKRDR